MVRKLSSGEKHFLRLIAKSQVDHGGWAPVSKIIYPLIEVMPTELVDREPLAEGGRARLTVLGLSLLEAMAWL